MQVKLISETKLMRFQDADLVWSLTQGRIYTVLGIEGSSFRLLHDDLRSPDNKPLPRPRPDLRPEEEKKTRPYPERFAPAPALYSSELFEVLDISEPDFWICKLSEDGERYFYPKEWTQAGFFEDCFDRKPEAHRLFWNIYYQLYSDSSETA